MRYSLSYKYNYEVPIYITIDNKAYTLEKNEMEISLIQFLDKNHIKIPRFCYHEVLSIAGNCRMCLIEIVGGLKLVISCATQILDGLEVLTNSLLIKKARESILEFLLINHPLDCPIRDQGGECDLQDQTSLFGSDRSRFFEIKRSVFDKNFGPFIKTIMTRCIHCTRCVRFMEDIVNEPVIGLFGRGKNSEISMYLNLKLDSSLIGNLIDICPVGALTSKPYAFKARPWELINISTIDILDSLNSNIIVSIKQNKIMRILPKINPDINGFWITDYIRFIYDSIYNNRLSIPYLKTKNIFKEITWDITFDIIEKMLLSNKKLLFIINNLESITTTYYINLLCSCLNSKMILENNNFNIIKNELKLNIQSNIFNNNLYILNDLNIKENLNIFWIKLLLIKNNIIQIGSLVDNSILHIGLGKLSLLLLLLGRHFISNRLLMYEINNLYSKDIQININNLNNFDFFLNTGEISYYYNNTNTEFLSYHNTIYFLYNTLNYLNNINLSNFIIYQGSHYTQDASKANILIPTLSFLEDSELYLNIFGFFQRTNKVIHTEMYIKSKIFILLHLLNTLKINVKFILKFLSQLNNQIEFIIYYTLKNSMFSINNFYYNGFKDLSNNYNLASKNIMSWFKYKQTNVFYRNI
jgi:NADH-quinone oxidoreductase subunit G